MPARHKGRPGLLSIPFALGLALTTAGLGGCSAFKPVEPPAAEAGAFDIDASRDALARAEAAERAGDLRGAAALYRTAAERWPTTQAAWSGLARVSEATGDEASLHTARFFEERVVDYDTMHPRQARMAFVTLRDSPPADQPELGLWAGRMVAFYEYKDAYQIRSAYDTRTPRSWIERNAIYPVAAGSVGGVVYGLGKSFKTLGD
ncbi:hypothetical protein CKO38_05765 [Rhodospirillum rubrum]|uniref:tetratricopeptide repeat protein n=1 Tax=Rhodospirillum rubrum TaxID=1085 RepID=UPI0019067C7F|nr:tetratricopeptide repeat protein [Rhodospirillum rubrum]MBK1663252.1 hypothetical protein [Rhodospirillum rubrum]MBK1676187.1 hypothetical protein [Rhodospirillum rubrum]